MNLTPGNFLVVVLCGFGIAILLMKIIHIVLMNQYKGD